MPHNFKPDRMLTNGEVTATHQQHQARGSAGIDIDARGLPEGSRAPVRSLVSGRVTISGGRYGTVEVTDNQGNRHRVLHLDSQDVEVNENVNRGDVIGRMGNTVPDGATTVRDHVHYQIKDPNNEFIDPDDFDFGWES